MKEYTASTHGTKEDNKWVQIIHPQGYLSIVALNVGSREFEIELFGSLYVAVLKDTQNTIINLFESTSAGIPVLMMAEMSKQEGVNDCCCFWLSSCSSRAELYMGASSELLWKWNHITFPYTLNLQVCTCTCRSQHFISCHVTKKHYHIVCVINKSLVVTRSQTGWYFNPVINFPFT